MIPDSFIGGSCRWLMKMINSSDPIPAGACRHCGAVIGLNNFICHCCSCSYPFIDLTNMDQMEEVTRSRRVLWQEVPEKTFGFGHPHKIPPDNRMLQVKYFTKMQKRLSQRKSTRTFNGGRAWNSYPEMFQFDLNWNGTMTRGGWIIHNIHLLEELIELAFTDLK